MFLSIFRNQSKKVVRQAFLKPVSCIHSHSYHHLSHRKVVIPSVSLFSVSSSAVCEGPRSFSSDDASDAKTVGHGDKVSILMEGKLADGTIFDSDHVATPFTFNVTNGEIIPGVDIAVRGMKVGESKKVVIPSEQGFGTYDEEMLLRIPFDGDNVKQDQVKNMKVGLRYQIGNGQSALVKEITDEHILLDMNHDLAGKELHISLTVQSNIPHADLPASEATIVPTEEITSGDGETFPQIGDTLKMHYTGMLTDGTIFDSSRTRGSPFEFEIGTGKVIRGWDEGVMKMSKGQRAKLYIPAAKGYGAQGAGNVIPPNADLIFDVELLEINREVDEKFFDKQ